MDNHITAYQQSETNVQRNYIYETHIHEPLTKLCECCVNYKKYEYALNNHGEIEGLMDWLLSMMVQALLKFDVTKGYKSFSYFSVSAKHALSNENKRLYKSQLSTDSIQALSDITDHQTGAAGSNNNKQSSKEDTLDFLKIEPAIHKHNVKDFMLDFADYLDKNRILCLSRQKVSKARDHEIIDLVVGVLRNPDEMNIDINNIVRRHSFNDTSRTRGAGCNSFVSILTERTGYGNSITRHCMNRIRKLYKEFKLQYFGV